MEARLKAVEQDIFKCQGIVGRGLSANHSMFTEFTRAHMVDGRSMKDIVFTFNERINFLQSQIYDLQNQVFEYEARFKGMSLAASCTTRETRASSFNGEPLPWKLEDKPTTSSSPPSSSTPPKET